MKNRTHSALAPLAAVLAMGVVVFLGGCSTEDNDGGAAAETTQAEGVTTSAADAPDAPAADGDTDAQDIEDEDGELPDWLSEGFPLYPGSRVAASSEVGDIAIVSFSVPNAEAQEIFDWFIAQYSAEGWVTDYVEPDGMALEATNADGRNASIDVTKSTYVISATPST